MKNNTIIERENATIVIAFGKELPKFLMSTDRPVSFCDGFDEPSYFERCRRVIRSKGYTITGKFLAYPWDDGYMCEDSTQWFYLQDIGAGIDIVCYQQLLNGEYRTLFDYRGQHIDDHVHSSFDNHWCGTKIGTTYCIGLVDYITGKSYYVPYESVYRKYDEENATFLPLDAPAQMVAGNLVRGMSRIEEQAWNEDRLLALVDLWGNISAVEEPNERWIRSRI